MSDECQELKNIKYQTMLLNSNSTVNNNNNHTSNLEDILKKEKTNRKKQVWSKLGRSEKLKKLDVFIIAFTNENKLNNTEKIKLKKYLIEALNKKKLHRVKDVTYDVEKEKIIAIPNLKFNKARQKFTLRNTDKKKSSLKCLAPRKKKNKIDIHLNVNN
jgi:hypothetical protein